MGNFAVVLEIPNPALVIIAIAVIAAVWVAFIFNRLVRLRNLLREAWSGIDVQLKRRHDVVPNLVETVKAYSKHEEAVLGEVARARGVTLRAESVHDTQTSENVLSLALKSLFAVAENYPALKADATYLRLQKQLVEIEDDLQMSRRYYNGTVRNFNIRVESFPDNLAAGLFGFRTKDFFEIETALAREAPRVELAG